MSRLLVSIALITYKHEDYIHEALDGIMIQEGIEDFEIVVGDDKSPDRTVEIIKERTKDHKLTKFLDRPSNVGMHQNWIDTIRACSGKYVALIEGDDVWTDPQKLKKQIAPLEANDSLQGSFTDTAVLNETEDGIEYGSYLSHQKMEHGKPEYSFRDLVHHNFISTVSVVLRNQPEWNVGKEYFKSPFVDWLIFMIKAEQGNLALINEVTCAYRLHNFGAFGYSSHTQRRINLVKCLRHIYFSLEPGEKRQWIMDRYLEAIEEYAQH